jgi:hypothetical protein
LFTKAVSEVSGKPLVGAVSVVAARSGPNAKPAKTRPIKSVTQADFLPVMKLISAFMFSPDVTQGKT